MTLFFFFVRLRPSPNNPNPSTPTKLVPTPVFGKDGLDGSLLGGVVGSVGSVGSV